MKELTTKRRNLLMAALAVVVPCTSVRPAVAQTKPTPHALTFSNPTEGRDAKGRVIIVGHVAGDLQGILTLALTVTNAGVVTAGEWALNVSFTQFGPADPDGDGDPSEVLVQRGVIKGSITDGGAPLNANGLATSANGLQLRVTGATVQFSTVTTGSGSFTGGGLLNSSTANGTLNLTF